MVSLFDMLALWLMIGVPVAIWMFAAKHFGVWTGIGAGLFSAIVTVTAVYLYHQVRGRKNARRRREFREKYTRVYCVLALPTDEAAIKKAHGAEIKAGDYGWEAAPLRDDGLIYLQGLNPQWRVVWYAGFRPDQIETVAAKPQSQYDWNYAWVRNPPPCPFPVQERLHPTINMGFPMPVKAKRIAVAAH